MTLDPQFRREWNHAIRKMVLGEGRLAERLVEARRHLAAASAVRPQLFESEFSDPHMVNFLQSSGEDPLTLEQAKAVAGLIWKIESHMADSSNTPFKTATI